MKAKREHIVPLSPQALEILDVMKPISAHREHIFPSRNNPKQAMNSQTANAALKRAGWNGKLVAHGLRSIASTTLNEKGFNPDVIEAALAHTDKNEVRRAYNRSVYLQQKSRTDAVVGNFVENKEIEATSSLSVCIAALERHRVAKVTCNLPTVISPSISKNRVGHIGCIDNNLAIQ